MQRTVEDVMTTKVITVSPSTPFRELVRLLAQHRISAVPVVDDAGRVAGVVSEADLLVKEVYPGGAEDARMMESLRHHSEVAKGGGKTAAELMTSPAITIQPGTVVADAARLAARKDVKRLPVVDPDGRLLGIVTRGDLLKVFLRPDPALEWDVKQELSKAGREIMARVDVSVLDGVVTLRGELEHSSQARELQRVAQRIQGVTEVRPELTWKSDEGLDRPWTFPVA